MNMGAYFHVQVGLGTAGTDPQHVHPCTWQLIHPCTLQHVHPCTWLHVPGVATGLTLQACI